MGLSRFPVSSTTATLQQTITATGAVTIPASVGLMYVRIGSSPTNSFVEGWVPNLGYNARVTASYTFYSCLWYDGGTANIYIYY
jgi:hypothetical protein